MTSLRPAFLLLLALGAVALAAPVRAADPDDDAIRATVARYFDAYSKQDLKALGECLGKSFATPQVPTREAYLARIKGAFDQMAPAKYEAKVKSLRREPDGTVVARVEFRGKHRLKGVTDEVEDEGEWAMIAAREGGTWKLTGILDAYLEVAYRARRAKTREERLAVFKGETDDFLQHTFLLKLFQEQSQLLDGGVLESAEMLQVLGEDAASAITDPDDRKLCQGLARWNRGAILVASDRYDEAVDLLNELIAEYRKDGFKGLEMDVSASLGVALAKQGNYRVALRLLEEYLANARKMAEPPKKEEGGVSLAPLFQVKLMLVEAQLYNALGVTHMEIGEYAKALDYLERALASAEKLNKPVLALNIRRSIAHLHSFQNRYPEAMRIYEQVLAAYRRAKLPYREAEVLHAMGTTLGEQGRYADAERHLEQARKLAAQVQNRRGEAFALASLADLRFQLGAREDAERYNNEALKLFRQIGYKPGIARCLRQQAHVATIARRPADAEKALAEAIALTEAGGSQVEAAQNAYAVARLYVRLGDIKKAKAALATAEAAYRKMGDRYLAAVTRYQKALIVAPDGTIHQDLAEVAGADREFRELNDHRLLRIHHEDRGFAHFLLGQWREAATEFEAAIRIMEQEVAGIEDPLLKASFADVFDARALPFMYIALTMTRAEQGDIEGVFRATERAKARSLGALLERTPGAVRKGLTAPEAKKEVQLREAVAAATKELHSAARFASNVPGRREQVTKDLRDAHSRYEEYRRQLSLAHPDLQGRLGDPPASSPADLQKALFAAHPDTAVVSYVVGWDRVLIVVATAGEKPDGPARVTVRSAKVTYKKLEQAADDLKAGCLVPEAGAPVSDDLWDWLIAPVEKDLAGKTHLVIVPCSPLLDLPFQAIRKQDGPYLLQRYAVSYAPSVATLVEMRRHADRWKAAAGPVPVVAVGGVNFSRDLRPLPATGPEAEAIGKLFGDRGRVLLGERANRQEVLKHAGSARFLHFATHALVNESRPLFSALAVTPAAGDDGRLYAHDVMDLDLSADLVVLSACETARGREYRGEGTVGLAWAFFVAGAPAVVVSQWSVADANTADLMRGFYGRLRAGTDPSRAESLRQAQLKMIEDRKTRHPFFWAPFVLVGDWRS